MSDGFPPPRWDPFPLQCKKCGTEWEAWQPQMVPMETWQAHAKPHRCPKCGAGSRHVLIRLDAGPPPAEAP